MSNESAADRSRPPGESGQETTGSTDETVRSLVGALGSGLSGGSDG
ncbi:hypothetical protein [Gordonia terrae]